MKNLLLEGKTMEEIKEYFENNNYNTEEVTTGYFGICADGHQDADFYEVEQVDETYNLYVC